MTTVRTAAQIVTCCAVVAVGDGCSEKSRNQYASVGLAREAGVFARGWLPDVLPDMAGPLIEHHDLDTNARCASVSFDRDSVTVLTDRAHASGFSGYDGTPPPPSQRWCPFDESDRQRARQVLVRFTEFDREFIALTDDAKLYFWSARK